MADSVNTIEHFYGVYLLYCKNPKYIGRTYIGYTVDPNRRIKQHNKGKHAGGAWKTSNRGPWSMVMIIHGFPNDVAALRFEWAWQHPQVSRRLNHIPKKKAREKTFDYCLRVLSEMLRIGPWDRLPLTVRWLDEKFIRDFPVEKPPPMHMPIITGAVVSKKLPKSQETISMDESHIYQCYLCEKVIDGKKLRCVSPSCDLVAHIICLSKCFLKIGEYVPVDGPCPKCKGIFLWGDFIRKLKGCYNNMNIQIDTDVGNDFCSSDSE